MEKLNVKSKLSLLWLFAILNYLYCDVLTLMDPAALSELMSGYVGTMAITEGFLFAAGILMEIPIAMVLFSQILKHKFNIWANLVAGTLMTIVQIMSLFVGDLTMYYFFFSVIEIVTTAYIVKISWSWRGK